MGSSGRSSFGEGGRSGGSGSGARGAGGRSSSRRRGGDAAEEGGPPDDPVAVARGICLRALTGAPKTRQQLAELLARKEIPEDAAATVLDRLTEVGLIDDEAFAEAWVSSRQSGRGLARRALTSELRAKGVDGEVAAQAVAVVDDEDERASARELVRRRARSMQRLDQATATRRLMGMLARKGYSGGMAASVVREVLGEAADAELYPDAD
ncbi:regulatory protein RecX [Modestobacter sp. I12A-02628]|uniref:Regulatory protein RecX n=1 Tax=Goekera deserti TaxID=2497753 RepID=A0A7K3WJV5_9ACTN|nr:regulatory protein RecX [Goekera deserti]MPQ96359.1 regulatory protein RecX [Goekera deserti]NDI50527.1 regulatory protein RecX [Goekera deserti]NEL56159.1 regulatory protein RecX [Goekera deserti]